jgi:hypothetical protein
MHRLHYQRIWSSSCARAATANLLLFHGIAQSRSDVRKTFQTVLGSKRHLVDHPSLLNVLQAYLPLNNMGWFLYRSFRFDKLLKRLTNSDSVGLPTLLTFHMRHVTMEWYGVHCVVVLSADRHGLHIIDSLGKRGGRYPNGKICHEETSSGWRVLGTPLLVTRGPARLLLGLPSSSSRLSL